MYWIAQDKNYGLLVFNIKLNYVSQLSDGLSVMPKNVLTSNENNEPLKTKASILS